MNGIEMCIVITDPINLFSLYRDQFKYLEGKGFDESSLRQEGSFYPAPSLKKWEEHLLGKRNWQYHLWGVLMFQAWLENE